MLSECDVALPLGCEQGQTNHVVVTAVVEVLVAECAFDLKADLGRHVMHARVFAEVDDPQLVERELTKAEIAKRSECRFANALALSLFDPNDDPKPAVLRWPINLVDPCVAEIGPIVGRDRKQPVGFTRDHSLDERNFFVAADLTAHSGEVARDFGTIYPLHDVVDVLEANWAKLDLQCVIGCDRTRPDVYSEKSTLPSLSE